MDVSHDLGSSQGKVAGMEGSTDRTDGIYSIGAVARMLGVPAPNAVRLQGL